MYKSLIILRVFWTVFAGLLLLGAISDIVAYWHPYQLEHWRRWLFVLLKIGVYFILIGNTYWNRQSLWFFALAVVSIKLMLHLKFYITEPFHLYSFSYYQEYRSLFYHLRIPHVAELFFGNNPISAVLVAAMYSYWLYLCEKLLPSSNTTAIK
jgi:hypothetical protein